MLEINGQHQILKNYALFKCILKMWRIDKFIRHKCGEHKIIVGRRCSIAYNFFNFKYVNFSSLQSCLFYGCLGDLATLSFAQYDITFGDFAILYFV